MLELEGLAEPRFRLGRLARGPQQDAEVVVAFRQRRLPVVVLRVRRGEGRLKVAGLLHRTPGLVRAAGSLYWDAGRYGERASRPSIFENCIVKNIHVPNMKSGPYAEYGCNFEYPNSNAS